MRVRNLSETGFGGHCDLVVDFADDEAVKIHFPHMSPVKAIIKWYAGKEAGVQFKQPLDLKRIAEARKAARQPPWSMCFRPLPKVSGRMRPNWPFRWPNQVRGEAC